MKILTSSPLDGKKKKFSGVVQMIQKSRDSLFLEVVAKQDDLLQVVRQFCYFLYEFKTVLIISFL